MSFESRLLAGPAPASLLVIDDEPQVRTFLREALSEAGYRVELAEDGRQAVEKVRGASFDLIICDLMMPVKTGVEFFADVSVQAPEFAERIIFLTGGAFTVKAREFLDRVPNPRLEKPFDLPALRALVNARVR